MYSTICSICKPDIDEIPLNLSFGTEIELYSAIYQAHYH